MELYDAIFYRKSIEFYSTKPITESLMKEVKKLCSNITYLNSNLNIKAHVIDRGHLINFSTRNKIQIKAPHYILITSNKGENYLENTGYALQGVTLEMACLGLGTTWLKCMLTRDEVEEFVNLDKIKDKDESEIEYPQAIIAFGYPQEGEALFRSSSAIHDRHKMKHICKTYDEKWFNALNALRVAPSINNCQPWTLEERENGFDLFENEHKKRLELDKYSKISMGIALKHFEIGCEHDNINIEYRKFDVQDKRRKVYFISILEKSM